MKVYKDASECPPITGEQRSELIQRVREGKLNWIRSLMKRANITPEECATPKAKFPIDITFDLLEKGYEVDTYAIHPKFSPVDIHKLHFYNFAVAHGISKSDVIEYIKYDKEFAEKLEEVQERAINGEKQFTITVDDLKPLQD